jgi:hypothetical protein
MTLFPDIQRKAQDEIDRVIGSDRLPELADRHSLPYVSALLNEVYRWRPVVRVLVCHDSAEYGMKSNDHHIGVPHKTTAADIYEGYYLPKGSIILPNILWVLRVIHLNKSDSRTPGTCFTTPQYTPIRRFLLQSDSWKQMTDPLKEILVLVSSALAGGKFLLSYGAPAHIILPLRSICPGTSILFEGYPFFSFANGLL